MLDFEPSLSDPLPLAAVSVIGLNVVLELGVHQRAIDQSRRTDNKHGVHESRMKVHEWMCLDEELTLRRDPTLQFHPIKLHRVVEVDPSRGAIPGQLIQRVQRTVASENDPLVSRTL